MGNIENNNNTAKHLSRALEAKRKSVQARQNVNRRNNYLNKLSAGLALANTAEQETELQNTVQQ